DLLGVVEEVPAALGGDTRMVGEDDRRAEHHIVVRRREHGPRVDAVTRSIQLRNEPPPSRYTKDRVGRDERVPEGVAARESARGLLRDLRPVLHPEGDPPAAASE